MESYRNMENSGLTTSQLLGNINESENLTCAFLKIYSKSNKQYFEVIP